PNLDPLAEGETIGFSRMEYQFRPNLDPFRHIEETIGFSRMESQFQPKPALAAKYRSKLRLHAAEADGLFSIFSRQKFLRWKLKLHAAESRWSLTDVWSG